MAMVTSDSAGSGGGFEGDVIAGIPNRLPLDGGWGVRLPWIVGWEPACGEVVGCGTASGKKFLIRIQEVVYSRVGVGWLVDGPRIAGDVPMSQQGHARLAKQRRSRPAVSGTAGDDGEEAAGGGSSVGSVTVRGLPAKASAAKARSTTGRAARRRAGSRDSWAF